jgi:hypothetical protein
VGADSIVDEADEYEDKDGWGVGSLSKSWDSGSESVGVGVVPEHGVSLNGEEFRGIDNGVSSLDSGTGDDDGRGLFMEGGKGRSWESDGWKTAS